MSNEVLIEDVLEEEIIKNLSYMYSFEEYKKVLTIFFMRCMIFNLSNTLNNEKIIEFLYRELNLPNSKILIYKNNKIFKNYYGFSNSIESIVDNWKFKILDEYTKTFNNKITTKNDVLMSKFNNYLSRAKNELKKSSKTNNCYTNSLKHFMLLFLYNDYDIDYINEPKKIDNLEYINEYEINDITIDLEYFRYYQALCFQYREKEKELEDFLYNKYNISNNNMLFGDIKIINRQYKTKAGILDLLGKDSFGNIVIIELKVVNRPIDIFYQIKAYTSHIKKEFKVDKVRFIAITPKLKDDIYEQIEKEDIELYYYNKKSDKFLFNKII